ncbi:MAG: Molybdopterin-guanine dinucleotide biosynthesis protein B [Candidatus Magnetoglobus multicellularis str. Araruama]|uniref:Molybdopterin-guanine dinucleotide biosynthesis protein B n=1 Tax=Candidatus Magnetoglobus multicellularis str. Araruama TaxID=890399 RepID=A0A1V1PH08_9BACT|nr:MAG: Molybdopterin-guanine dinucleotide biosynthesis protein B [Candidatus Magnetoglobus multicellularis str. Araruama]
MNSPQKPLIISFVGHSNSGKTGLITQLIPKIKEKGFRVGVIKHAGSPIVIDRQGKDSHRHFEAGADPTMVCTNQHLALFARSRPNMGLADIAQRFFYDTDILLTEGYKQEAYPKIEVYVASDTRKPLCLTDTQILAIVTNEKAQWHIPHFDCNDINGLVHWITAVMP